MKNLKIEILTEINEAENGRFRNAVEFVDDKTVIIYAMNTKTKEIHEILIDIDDLPKIVGRYSSINVTNKGYARGVVRGKHQDELIHRFIFGDIPDGLVCDHISGDKLDNRKSNLRQLTHAENTRTARKIHSSTGFRNVSKTASGKFQVLIRKDAIKHYFGSYDTPEEANEVAKVKRVELFDDL